MEYNDFQILGNYEKIAKEYYSQMKNKGFVFMKLEDDRLSKNKLSSKVIETMKSMLDGYKRLEPYLKKNEREFLSKLYNLSQTQIGQLERIYIVNAEKIYSTSFNIQKVVSKEAVLLELLFELLLSEEGENFVLIKNIIFDRLKLLQTE